jgi:hypothetical protein
MLKRLLVVCVAAAIPVGTAQAATIVLLPEPGSMSPPTIIVDPDASKDDPVLVCGSMAQLSAGTCVLQPRTSANRRN